MARTPVTTEVIAEAQALAAELSTISKSKREPVPAESGWVIEKGAPLDSMTEAAENGAMDAKPRAEINPIIDGYRDCARPDCGAAFKPRSVNPKDDDVTEYYCSSDCAIHEFYRKRGLGAVPEKVVSGASTASNRAHREEKKRERVAAAPERDAKYGPMRKVVEVLGETKTAKKVKLECGHITAARGEQQRCRQCRPGAGEKKKRGKKTPVEAAVAPKKEPTVKRQPVTRATVKNVTRATVKKSKRTPVKPPKRGKKGKR